MQQLKAADWALLDTDGRICGITLYINTEEPLNSFTGSGSGLCNEYLREPVIDEGIAKEGKVVLDFSRFYQEKWHEAYEPKGDTDAVRQAQKMAGMCIDMFESRGEHAAQYRDIFVYDSDFETFTGLPWDQIEENWTAGEGYHMLPG